MYTDILYDILLGLICISVVFVIIILWRIYLILTDVNLMTKSIKNISGKIEGAVNNISRGIGNAKEFVEGFESIAGTIGRFFHRKKDKDDGEKEGEQK